MRRSETKGRVDASYSLKQVREIVGLGAASVRALIDRGFVNPTRGDRRELRFTFQELLLLKTAQGLRLAKVPARRILSSLTKLRAELPEGVPLTGLRITASGADVAVKEASGVREPNTGQLLLDFDVNVGVNSMVVADRLVSEDETAEAAFQLAEKLEESDASRAEAVYWLALSRDAAHTNAAVNLGALLCEQGRCEEAAGLLEATAAAGGVGALLQFNLAIAYEDLGRPHMAVEAYRQAIVEQPEFADAHYNLGLLLEQFGDAQGALRHLSAYRRLMG